MKNQAIAVGNIGVIYDEEPFTLWRVLELRKEGGTMKLQKVDNPTQKRNIYSCEFWPLLDKFE